MAGRTISGTPGTARRFSRHRARDAKYATRSSPRHYRRHSEPIGHSRATQTLWGFAASNWPGGVGGAGSFARPGYRGLRQRPGLRVSAGRTNGTGGHRGKVSRPTLAHGCSARATVAGSGALLAASQESAAELRKAVTSPAGTTEAALRVLMAPEALPRAFSEAIAAATRRSRELAG